MTDEGIMKQCKNCRICGCLLGEDPVLCLDGVPQGVLSLVDPAAPAGKNRADIRVFECFTCGHVQIDGQPVVYNEELTSTVSMSPSMLEHRRGLARTFASRFGLVGKGVLDVGCGDGHFVSLLRDQGVAAVGIEPCARSVTLGYEGERPIIHGVLDSQTPIEAAPFEGFVLLDVLEHISEPTVFLRSIALNMAEGAYGMVKVPNVGNILSHGQAFDFVADHLSYFSATSLSLCLQLGGFEVLDVVREMEGDDIVAYVRKRTSFPWQTLQQKMQQTLDEVDQLIFRVRDGGGHVAVWGASHNAFTLLALRNKTDIEYIIDSAETKQGKLSPVLRLPIVPPSHLRDNPVDAVLIVTHRYAPEIARTLTDQLKFSGEIVVVKGAGVKSWNEDC